MRRTLSISGLAAILLACQPLAQAQPLEKITINFPTRSAASWPIFIAKEGGYYQKYGLDANIVFGVHPTGIAMIVSDQAQMTNYSLETAMQATARDGSLVILGSWLNKAVFALMARKEFTSATQLKGKRIAVSQLGDAPSNYATALLKKFGLSPRDIDWIAVGTDVNGRAAALESGRAEATLLTAPTYFKLEEAGYKNLGNIADYDDIFAATTILMKKSTVAAHPKLPDLLLQAHAEAIQRFYQDKDFAVKAYIAYDPQSRVDVERVYDLHYKANMFERVPYVLSGAVQAVIAQQTDPPMIALMKGYDYRKVVDNNHVDRLVKAGFYEKLFGPSVKMEEDRKSKLAFR